MRPSDLKSLKGFLDAIRSELSSIGQSIKESSSSIADKEVAKQETENNQRKEISHAIDKLAYQQNQSSDASEANQDRRHGQGLKPQWFTAIATIFAFLAAAIYAWEAHDQIEQMIKATQQAKRSADIAACALRENQRQFQIASENNQKQFSETLEQMKAQSRASASAANTAAEGLQISERAYVVSGSVQLDWARKVLYVPIENLGHIPSGRVHVVIHLSKTIKNPGGGDSNEVRWTEVWFNSLTSNAPVTSPQITFEPDLAKSGTEFIHLGVEIEYHDGFHGTPLRTQGTAFCSFHSKEGAFLFGPCPFSNMLELLKKADQYPSPKYQKNIPITDETMQPPVPTMP